MPWRGLCFNDCLRRRKPEAIRKQSGSMSQRRCVDLQLPFCIDLCHAKSSHCNSSMQFLHASVCVSSPHGWRYILRVLTLEFDKCAKCRGLKYNWNESHWSHGTDRLNRRAMPTKRSGVGTFPNVWRTASAQTWVVNSYCSVRTWVVQNTDWRAWSHSLQSKHIIAFCCAFPAIQKHSLCPPWWWLAAEPHSLTALQCSCEKNNPKGRINKALNDESVQIYVQGETETERERGERERERESRSLCSNSTKQTNKLNQGKNAVKLHDWRSFLDMCQNLGFLWHHHKDLLVCSCVSLHQHFSASFHGFPMWTHWFEMIPLTEHM